MWYNNNVKKGDTMERIKELLKNTRKQNYGFIVSLVLVLITATMLFILFDNLRPITVFVGVLLIAFIGVKVIEQFQSDKEYNESVEALIKIIDNDAKKGLRTLESFLRTQRKELNEFELSKDREFTRLNIIHSKKRQIRQMQLRVSDLEIAQDLLRKEAKRQLKSK